MSKRRWSAFGWRPAYWPNRGGGVKGWRWAILPVVAAAALLAAACTQDDDLPTEDVVFSIPWTVGEESSYSILDDDGESLGTGILKIDQDEEGRLRLVQEYENPEFSDQLILLAEAETLKPISIERVISGDEGVLQIEGRYSRDVVEVERIVVEDDKEERRTDRLDIPENAYDNASSLFLWRTMRLGEGFQAAYNSLATAEVGKPQSIRVTTRVAGRETVKVPAGIFEAWRLEIRFSGRGQTAWYATEGSRPLVKYDNGEVFFLLEDVKEEGNGG